MDAFLTFAHREPAWSDYAKQVETLHRVCPQVCVMHMMHPSMEAVSRPLAHRWPWASEAIMTADGKPFEAYNYSRSWARATSCGWTCCARGW